MDESIESDFIVKHFSSFRSSDNHLIEDRFFLFEFSQLFLEIGILFFLVDHAQFKRSIQGIDERASGIGDFIICIFDLVSHALEFLSE